MIEETGEERRRRLRRQLHALKRELRILARARGDLGRAQRECVRREILETHTELSKLEKTEKH